MSETKWTPAQRAAIDDRGGALLVSAAAGSGDVYKRQRKEGLFVQTFYKICLILMIVGGINWGLVGLFQFDFVGWLLGGSEMCIRDRW